VRLLLKEGEKERAPGWEYYLGGRKSGLGRKKARNSLLGDVLFIKNEERGGIFAKASCFVEGRWGPLPKGGKCKKKRSVP